MVTGVESTRSRNQKDGRSLFAILLGKMMLESLGIGGDVLSNKTSNGKFICKASIAAFFIANFLHYQGVDGT
jgi:hypothetical protein